MDESQLSVESQLAVIRTKVDILIDMTKTRGDNHEARIRELEINGAGMDHETRVRQLEERSPDYITKKAATTLVITVCTLLTTASSALLFFTR